jgi:hypothetical protein
MAEIDVNAYATTSANAAAGAPTIVETQQPGDSGALRQVTIVGDPTTRANMQKVDSTGSAMIAQIDTATNGTISATDVLCPAPAGNGVLVSTAPTASSFVFAVVPGGTAQADIQITGTATGTYYFEGSMDSTTGSDGSWAALNYRQTGIVNTVLGYSATATNTVYRGAPSGFKYIRVRNVGGTTPSNPVIIRYSNGGGTTFLNASIPAGTNTIGAVKSTIVQAGITNLTALNQAQQLTMQGESGMAVQLAGTWTATVSFEASNDATNWTTINAQRAGDNAISQTVVNSTNNDLYRIGVSGFGYVRIRTSAYTSGTVVVTSVTSFASSTTVLSASIPAGTNNIGKITAGSSTTGGATMFNLVSAATTNATLVKATVGTLYSINCYNNGASTAYIKLYNKATAPTVGTDVPVKVIMLPAGGGSNVVAPAMGYAFSLGIAYAVTGGAANTDTTAVALSQVLVNGSYA